MAPGPRKADVRLPGKRNSNSHGARPVHLIITLIKWIRTGRLSIKNSLSGTRAAVDVEPGEPRGFRGQEPQRVVRDQPVTAAEREERLVFYCWTISYGNTYNL